MLIKMHRLSSSAGEIVGDVSGTGDRTTPLLRDSKTSNSRVTKGSSSQLSSSSHKTQKEILGLQGSPGSQDSGSQGREEEGVSVPKPPPRSKAPKPSSLSSPASSPSMPPQQGPTGQTYIVPTKTGAEAHKVRIIPLFSFILTFNHLNNLFNNFNI